MSESAVKRVGAFVDTLVLNVYPTDLAFQEVEKRRVSSELQEELAALKEQAQVEEEDIPTRFAFAGVPLVMTRKGAQGFQWILKNAKLTIAVNRGSKMALLAQVRCSSEYLWRLRDLGKVITEVHTFLMLMFGDYIILQVSACDLALDVVGLDLGSVHDVKQHFVTRAQLTGQMPLDVDAMIDGPESIKQRWGRLTGLPFGARTGAVSALIYDKRHEIKYKSPDKKWFYDLWLEVRDEDGNPMWDGESAVWRIEVRYRREALNEMKQEGVFHGINDAYELEEQLAGLWSYAVGHVGGGSDGLPDGWLRYVVPVEDTNRSRWPVHPDWEVIQAGFAPEVVEESDYEREEREKEELLQEVDAHLAQYPMVTSKTPKRRKRTKWVAASMVAAPAPSPSFDLLPFIRKRKYKANMERMIAQVAGCTITAEAWRLNLEERADEERLSPGVKPDISDTFHFLYRQVENYLREKEATEKVGFVELVQKKRVLYSVELA